MPPWAAAIAASGFFGFVADARIEILIADLGDFAGADAGIGERGLAGFACLWLAGAEIAEIADRLLRSQKGLDRARLGAHPAADLSSPRE